MGTNITGIGNANAIGFKSRVTGGMYFPPELKDALVGVWSAYGKSNDSTDRNIIKNKIKDRGGDFELINFNYEGTSGYNGYPVIFGKDKTYQYINHSSNYNQTTINVTHFNTRQALLYSYVQQNGELTSYNRDYPSYKIKVSGLEESFGLMYQYNSKANATSVSALRIETDGIYTIPKSFTSNGSLTNASVWVGFMFIGTEQEQCNVTIEVLPEYKGAVVTDGVDDMIVSTKTMSEILEGSNEVTVISMMANLEETGSLVVNVGGKNYLRNIIASATTNKCGIFGYSSTNINTIGNISVINNILGDKNDYTANYPSSSGVKDVFSVSGFEDTNDNTIKLVRKIVWYWTFIAKRVLTEDEINLVIEKYNLDRPGEIVKPDVYYDIKRQKINNENHSSFDDELIDFSGNGHNMRLYNIAWEGNSGIGNYPVIFGANKTWKHMPTYNSIYSNNGSKIHITKVLHAGNGILFSYAKINDVLQNIKEIPSFKVKVSGLEGNSTLRYSYIKTEDAKYQSLFDLNNGVHEVPKSLVPTDAIVNNTWIGFTIMPIYEEVREFDCDITIEVIPSDENTICLDGVDDYGKVTGLPILKDYTVAADYIRTFAKESAQDSPILSKSKVQGAGAFLFNFLDANSRQATFSFGKNTGLTERVDDSKRSIYYQSKYINNGNDITAGTAIDYEDMWLGTYRDNTSNFFTGALYFAMLFPYSLSEFLLERQIKKARTGTLYPNQVEFRPIIPEDENITKIDYFVVDSGVWTVIKPGDYVDVGARIVLNVYTKLPYKIEKVSSLAFTGMSVGPSTELNIFNVKGYIKDKTPQKIKITLAVNEDIIQWNPTITSNLPDSFTASSWYLNGWDNTLTEGTWIKKTDRVFFKATFKTELYGLETATFGGAECVVSKADNWSNSVNIWDIRMLETVGDLSQVFNLDVCELIRYEDIVQPYPSLFTLIDYDTEEVYSWGSKLKLGTKFKGEVINLLPDMYQWDGDVLYNGKVLNWTINPGIVAKEMIFSWSKPFKYLFDNNAPKCILSPSRLRIPNSSYKILGYIPDISGHSNHGKINNSAYAGMSGANGYPYDYSSSSFTVNTNLARKLNGEKVEYFAIGISEGFIYNDKTYKGKVKITGVSKAISNNEIYNFRIYSNTSEHIESSEYIAITEDGIYDIDIKGTSQDASKVNFFAVTKFSDVVKLGTPITIEQVGEYEGAYCLDGVDDFITIPTTVGGKQTLMKVNWSTTDAAILYDQIGNPNEFAIFNGIQDMEGNPAVAYQGRNNGKTYIDGILNNYIQAPILRNVIHNITITNNLSLGENKKSPTIGCNSTNDSYFTNMSLYDFMLFDEISTNDNIKKLNEYVGIEGNVFAINPTIKIDLPLAIKNIKIYHDGNEINLNSLFINKDTEFEIHISLNEGNYAIDNITVDGVNINKDRIVGDYNIFKFTLNGSSEQNIAIHDYKYIKYEDIVQPYPTIFELKDVDTNTTYTYGSKLKIGSEFLFNKWTNLLPELYRPTGSGRYNGNEFKTGNRYVVEETMVFSWSSPIEYLLDSAPKCIFSPSKLRMPNESYRYLGYIPDISGNGNNGVFNNFAFGGMSGVDGYPFNFRTIAVLVKKVSFTDDTLVIDRTSTSDQTWVLNLGKQSESFDLYVNWEDDSTRLLVWAKNGIIVSQYTLNKEWNSIPVVTDDYDYIYLSYINPSTLGKTTIKQKAKYEGSICFDGVDDYITIPTLSEGGKQVLMKVNWQKQDTMLYNQNPGQDNFAIFTNDYNNNNLVVAYASRNNGNTYIDGVVNNNILATQLKGITHNIVATNNNIDATITPIIGSNKNHDNFFAQMALYDFMLFDEISTDEEIKELNNIVGIEGDYVQKPSYYWDAYGKSNLDVDKGYIKDQVSLQLNDDTTNNNSLENFNFGYEGMSGYNGYPVVLGIGKTYGSMPGIDDFTYTVTQNTVNITKFNTTHGLIYSYLKRNGELETQNLDYPSYKIKITGLEEGFNLHYYYLSSPSDTSINRFVMKTDGIYTIPKSYASDGSLVNTNVWIGFIFEGTVPESCNVTIEVLPEYKNGLVYDGVDDYSKNASIPLLSDYTYIFKRTLLNKKYNSASIFKGSNQQSGGGAFICDYNSVEPDLLTQGYSFGAGLYVDSLNADSIVYGTRGSVNGTKITAGNNTDTEGLTVGKWRAYKEMVFYKLFLYPRTVNMLSINMVKNMMEEDGIIDLTSKLFTDKYTGDFYEMDFNNDFLIGN